MKCVCCGVEEKGFYDDEKLGKITVCIECYQDESFYKWLKENGGITLNTFLVEYSDTDEVPTTHRYAVVNAKTEKDVIDKMVFQKHVAVDSWFKITNLDESGNYDKNGFLKGL